MERWVPPGFQSKRFMLVKCTCVIKRLTTCLMETANMSLNVPMSTKQNKLDKVGYDANSPL